LLTGNGLIHHSFPMQALIIVTLLLLSLLAIAVYLLTQARAEKRRLSKELQALISRFQGVYDADKERENVLLNLEAERQQLNADITGLKTRRESMQAEAKQIYSALRKIRSELEMYSEEAHLMDFGFYEPHFSFPDSDGYKDRLDQIRKAQKQLIKEKRAAVSHKDWQVGGSAKEGKRLTDQRLKLMLRAFNGECDSAIAKVRYNNIHVMDKRITKAFETINKLSSSLACELTKEFYNLKILELQLEHEYRVKKQEEKDEQRRIREEMREEARAKKEIEDAIKQAEQEAERNERALQQAREELSQASQEQREKLEEKISALERQLEESTANKERAISRAQLTRSGHVYVISNVGSFGERTYKIGMTRRLDPMDRVKELGDASVPFTFDVHAIMYADDAPALEAQLHNHFSDRRVNRVNHRKEFFRVTIDEIAEVLRGHDAEIEITKVAEAEEYRQTLALEKKLNSDADTEVVEEPRDALKDLLGI